MAVTAATGPDLLMSVVLLLFYPLQNSGQLILTGVAAVKKDNYFVELYSYGDVSDVSVYSLKMGTKTFSFPAGFIPTGRALIASSQPQSWFTSYMGATPQNYYYSTEIDLPYGQTTVELRKNNMIVDRYGHAHEEGLGNSAWSYGRGWSMRNEHSMPSGDVYAEISWTYHKDAFTGTSCPNYNNLCADPYTYGVFMTSPVNAIEKDFNILTLQTADSYHGQILGDHDIKRIRTRSAIECGGICARTTNCKSINFEKYSTSKWKDCILNNATISEFPGDAQNAGLYKYAKVVQRSP